MRSCSRCPIYGARRSAVSSDDGHPRSEARTVARHTQIVQLAHEDGIALWHDGATQDAFATVPVGGHREHHGLTSRAFREWLAR